MRAGSLLLPFGLVLLGIAAADCGPQPDPLIALSGPREVIRFELRDGVGRVLWAIESREARTLRSLDYGELPASFRQLVPADSRRPRPLVDGEPLTAETRTRRRVWMHEGYAAGRSSFRATNSSMRLIDRPADQSSS